ncbi:glycosyltransferase, partial [bacterium]|nr:glycosyltransferase [bacterium]
TRIFLSSLLSNSGRVEEVFVVDNGSTDGTAQLLEEFLPKFREWRIRFDVICNDSNLGFGRACNQGIRKASCEWVAIVNNDTWLMPNWDVELQREAQKRALDLIGPHFDERPWTDEIENRARDFLQLDSGRFRRHFVPILMFFRKDSLERLRLEHGGIFDERFFVTFEDTDLRYRMERLGMRYGQTGSCYIWHQSMGTRSAPGMLPEGYEQEGLRLFVEKWGFDPRKAENTLWQRFLRGYRRFRASQGRF